jgi:hypothetical protein
MFEIDDVLEFYTALGFDITYYQKAPYRFASVKNNITEISFYGDKNFDVEKNAGGCYIVVPNIEEVYNKLKSNLKNYYGKIPVRGLPRFSKLNQTAEEERLKSVSTFEKKYKQAYRFAYSKEDFRAAKMY